METFAHALRRLRLAKTLRQEDLAVRSGISRRTISNWEQGRVEPGSLKERAVFDNLAEALELSTDQKAQLRTTLPFACGEFPEELIPTSVRPPTPLLELEHRYRHWISVDCARFPLIGFSRSRVDLASCEPSLEHVFVRPRASKSVPHQRRRVQLEDEMEDVDLLSALKDAPKSVILGAPGTGKSTMLRFLAWAFAQGQGRQQTGIGAPLLPVLVSLGGFSAERQRKGAAYSIVDYLHDALHGQNREVPADFFRWYLERGHCLVLFDGLDLVGESSQHAEIASSIEAIVQDHPHNRYVVTSRITSYQDCPLDRRQFTHFVLRDFDNNHIRTFINGWYEHVEGGLAEGQVFADELIARITANPGINHLATNPLMLAILTAMHQTEQLPNQRVRLYDKCTESLLYKWEALRSSAKPPAGEEEMRRCLEHVGWWLHANTDERMRAGEVHRIELHAELRRFFTARGEAHPDDEASAFLSYAHERAGILVEHGIDVYGFTHYTFQEYFAACHLVNQYQSNLDLAWLKQTVVRYLHDGHWEEVILLTLAQLPPHAAAQVVQAILIANSWAEAVLKRDVLMAARVLAEDVEIEEAIAESVLSELGNIVLTSRCSRKPWEALQAVKSLRNSRYRGPAARMLLRLLNDPAIRWERAEVVGALGDLGEESRDIKLSLLSLASNESDDSVREAAAESLAKLRDTNAAMPHLEGLARGAKEEYVRKRAIEALGNLEVDSNAAVPILMSLTEEAEPPELRSAAAESLGQSGNTSGEVMLRLCELARQQHDKWLALSAARALAKLGRHDEAVDFVCALPTLGEEPWLLFNVAGFLVANGASGKGFALLEAISRYTESGPRQTRDSGNEKSADSWDNVLRSSKQYLAQLRACQVLVNFGQKEKAVELLLKAVRGHEDTVVLDEMDDWQFVGAVAAEILAAIDCRSGPAIDWLVSQVENSREASVCAAAAKTLGVLGVTEPASAAVKRLLGLFVRFRHAPIALSLLETIATLGARETAVSSILRLLEDPEWQCLRREIIKVLGKIGEESPFVLNALLEMVDEGDLLNAEILDILCDMRPPRLVPPTEPSTHAGKSSPSP